MKKILSTIIVTSILIVPVFFINAQGNKQAPILENLKPMLINNQTKLATGTQTRLEVRSTNMEQVQGRIASTTERVENRLEMRNTNMEQVKARIASTTQRMENRVASTSDRLAKKNQKLNEVKERLLNREFKFITVLEQIADKIQTRIDILTERGLDMAKAQAKLDLALENIIAATNKASDITTELETEITMENKAETFAMIKSSHDEIRIMAKETHGLLVETVKEITKVLPAQNRTATSTNN
jgi:hypothetical protein